uniref:Uncharacterized protein n=1 Tax=Vespula pensylvanica TaxID=30213 RepID=A0A834U502_VESPE|nr:hypothetical protein H0235_011550 [Vespula pensylvanica]
MSRSNPQLVRSARDIWQSSLSQRSRGKGQAVRPSTATVKERVTRVASSSIASSSSSSFSSAYAASPSRRVREPLCHSPFATYDLRQGSLLLQPPPAYRS